MKVLLCGKCMDIRALDPQGIWTPCRCGNMQAKWVDPQRGTVKVRADDKKLARIIGLNNSFLLAAFDYNGTGRACTMNADWKAAHEEATKAPGYIFDEAKRGCWACIVEVGQTNDITWEDWPPSGI